MVAAGELLTLRIEKPAAGGRMIARYHGQIVLVAGAIPGEVVRVRVERVGKGVAYALTIDVEESDGTRRAVGLEWACGGNTYAHIVYERQRALKSEIVRDALARIGRIHVEQPIPIAASPETGYRMRARFHVRRGALGFFKEGTHELCDWSTTGQLASETTEALTRLWSRLRATPLAESTDLELAENLPATERAVHVDLGQGVSRVGPLQIEQAEGFRGISYSRRDHPGTTAVWGEPYVTDNLSIHSSSDAVRLRRHVRAFFQGNRYLLTDLIDAVVGATPDTGPVVDLYSGVGLFGVSLAAARRQSVVAVEEDRTSSADLVANATPYAGTLTTWQGSVESFLARTVTRPDQTFVVDPPRTGISAEALPLILNADPSRIVYVSCDAATLARDLRAFVGAGYRLEQVRGFDLFPNTPHVETMAVLTKGEST